MVRLLPFWILLVERPFPQICLGDDDHEGRCVKKCEAGFAETAKTRQGKILPQPGNGIRPQIPQWVVRSAEEFVYLTDESARISCVVAFNADVDVIDGDRAPLCAVDVRDGVAMLHNPALPVELRRGGTKFLVPREYFVRG